MLRGKYLNFSCAIELIISTVYFICSYGLHHHQFCDCFLGGAIKAEYPEFTVSSLASSFTIIVWALSQDLNFSEEENPSSTTMM